MGSLLLVRGNDRLFLRAFPGMITQAPTFDLGFTGMHLRAQENVPVAGCFVMTNPTRHEFRRTILLALVVSGPYIATLAAAARGADPSPTGGLREALPLRPRDTPKPDYGAAVPAEIVGRVALGAETSAAGVEGVSVTDGYSVVKTDATGNYTLKPDASAVFVYITRPYGYDVKAEWYRPLAEKVDFVLQPAVDEEDTYTFVHMTDAHVSTNPTSMAGLSDFVRELNALTPSPRFVVNSGDLINLNKALGGSPAEAHRQIRNYVGIMNHLTMPYYNVAGDHTDSSYRLDEFPRGDHRCGKPLYWEYLGPHFFSFEYGRIHFVSVDNGYHLGRRKIKGADYPTLQVQPMHTAWMRQDMANRTQGTFVVTTSEGDLCEGCPGFAEMAARYDVRLQLIGDNHVVSEKLISRKPKFVPFRTAGAVAGCWWNAKCNRLCPDLNPQGYLIYRVRAEEMSCFYKGIGQRVAIVSHRVGAPWKGQVPVRAHLVQPENNDKLEYTLDGERWTAMTESGRPFYRAVYQASVDSTTVPDGLAELKVRSSQTGETRSRPVVVVNGSSRAAGGANAVLTFTTAARLQKTPIAPAGKVDVHFNDMVVGTLAAGALQDYAFTIPSAALREVNTLRFRFAQPDDGMNVSSPVLTVAGRPFRDPRDEAVRKVRIAHWGTEATDWGGFVVGDGDLIATPFLRKQNTFCFIVSAAE